MIGTFFTAVYLALVIVVVWHVIVLLRRISQGVDDIAQTLKRRESSQLRQPSGLPPSSAEPERWPVSTSPTPPASV